MKNPTSSSLSFFCPASHPLHNPAHGTNRSDNGFRPVPALARTRNPVLAPLPHRIRRRMPRAVRHPRELPVRAPEPLRPH